MRKMIFGFKKKIRKNNFDINIDFDVYRSYQRADADDYVSLTPTGWELLFSEVLSPIIEKELGLKYLGGYTWADEYYNHRRKVLRLFLINQAYATFQWGWNFDFVPKQSGSRLVYARTDKSVYPHIFEMSEDFYNNTKNRKRTIISAFGGSLDSYQESIVKMAQSYIDAFYYLLPLIQSYYQRTDTYDMILRNIDFLYGNGYFSIMIDNLLVTKVFIEYHLKWYDAAIKHFDELDFENDDIKNVYLKALKKLDDMN